MQEVLVNFKCSKEFRDAMKVEAKKRGLSMSGFIKSTMYERMNEEVEVK